MPASEGKCAQIGAASADFRNKRPNRVPQTKKFNASHSRRTVFDFLWFDDGAGGGAGTNDRFAAAFDSRLVQRQRAVERAKDQGSVKTTRDRAASDEKRAREGTSIASFAAGQRQE